MIKSKHDLELYLKEDMGFYNAYSDSEKFILKVLQDPCYHIARYIRYLRYEEYYYNTGKNVFEHILYHYYLRKKNMLGNKLGFKIPKNCIGKGLTIYHHGNVIINESARIGDYCKLHGNNCIGNNGKTEAAPVIGDGLDLGFGAVVIGDVKLENNITVGANAVVCNSINGSSVTIVGVPAKPLLR